MLLWLACAAPDELVDTHEPAPAEDTGGAGPDTALSDTSPPPEDDGWYGQLLDPPLELPAFSATASDGTGRGPEHLVRPTALWFFRDGGSFG